MPDQPSTTPPESDEQGWFIRTGLTLYEVEQFLDWLEQNGCTSREVELEVGGATVRWRLDPPHTPKRS